MIDLYQPIMSWKLSWCIHIKYKRQLIKAFKHKPSFNGTAVTICNFRHSCNVDHVEFFLESSHLNEDELNFYVSSNKHAL